jgi:hypothetical protein
MSGNKYSLYDVGPIAPSPSISKPPSAASSQSDEDDIYNEMYQFITANYPNIVDDLKNFLMLNNQEHIETMTNLTNSLNDKYFSNLTGGELEELKGMIGVDDINKLIDIEWKRELMFDVLIDRASKTLVYYELLEELAQELIRNNLKKGGRKPQRGGMKRITIILMGLSLLSSILMPNNGVGVASTSTSPLDDNSTECEEPFDKPELVIRSQFGTPFIPSDKEFNLKESSFHEDVDDDEEADISEKVDNDGEVDISGESEELSDLIKDFLLGSSTTKMDVLSSAGAKTSLASQYAKELDISKPIILPSEEEFLTFPLKKQLKTVISVKQYNSLTRTQPSLHDKKLEYITFRALKEELNYKMNNRSWTGLCVSITDMNSIKEVVNVMNDKFMNISKILRDKCDKIKVDFLGVFKPGEIYNTVKLVAAKEISTYDSVRGIKSIEYMDVRNELLGEKSEKTGQLRMSTAVSTDVSKRKQDPESRLYSSAGEDEENILMGIKCETWSPEPFLIARFEKLEGQDCSSIKGEGDEVFKPVNFYMEFQWASQDFTSLEMDVNMMTSDLTVIREKCESKSDTHKNNHCLTIRNLEQQSVMFLRSIRMSPYFNFGLLNKKTPTSCLESLLLQTEKLSKYTMASEEYLPIDRVLSEENAKLRRAQMGIAEIDNRYRQSLKRTTIETIKLVGDSISNSISNSTILKGIGDVGKGSFRYIEDLLYNIKWILQGGILVAILYYGTPYLWVIKRILGERAEVAPAARVEAAAAPEARNNNPIANAFARQRERAAAEAAQRAAAEAAQRAAAEAAQRAEAEAAQRAAAEAAAADADRERRAPEIIGRLQARAASRGRRGQNPEGGKRTKRRQTKKRMRKTKKIRRRQTKKSKRITRKRRRM